MDNSARHHHRNARSVAAFLILLVAFSILLVFYVHKDEIMQPNTFPQFMVLAAAGLGLLTVLLYFVGKEHKPAKAKSASRSTKKVASKKKKKK
jgi:drug/metabolite transporter (DMT)-like permease